MGSLYYHICTFHGHSTNTKYKGSKTVITVEVVYSDPFFANIFAETEKRHKQMKNKNYKKENKSCVRNDVMVYGQWNGLWFRQVQLTKYGCTISNQAYWA